MKIILLPVNSSEPAHKTRAKATPNVAPVMIVKKKVNLLHKKAVQQKITLMNQFRHTHQLK